MSIVSKIIGTVLLFILTIVSGIWLSNSGKPLNTLIFNIHKLVALVSVIFIAIVIRNLLRNVEINHVILTLIIVTGLFVLILFISGALLSLGKPVNNIILTIHATTPIPTVITTAITIYLILVN
jgi:Na+/glutamate symporter